MEERVWASDSLASISQMLGSQMCTTTFGIFHLFWCFPTFLFQVFCLPKPPSLSAQRPSLFLACVVFSLSPTLGSITVPKAAASAAQFSHHGQHSIPAHLEAIWSSAVPTWPFCCVPMFLAPVPCKSSLEDRLVFCVSSLGFYSGHGKQGKLWVIQVSAVIALSSSQTWGTFHPCWCLGLNPGPHTWRPTGIASSHFIAI